MDKVETEFLKSQSYKLFYGFVILTSFSMDPWNTGTGFFP